MRSALLVVLALIVMLTSGKAHAEKRVALIIGMSKYERVPQLVNPARDAEAVSSLFRSVGFDIVNTEHDLGIADLRRSIRNFSDIARDADIAVVYYAGHGIEVDGVNYLIPADAKLSSDFDIEDETISLDRVLKALEGAKRLKLIALDACRDNPFAKTMRRTVTSRSIGRGLAKVEPATSDMLIAFAAKAGAVASDGDGEHSPFASALVRNIAEPGLDLRLAFGRIRDEVLKATANRQEPFVYGSLGGETMALVPKPADMDAAARVDYELAAQVSTMDAWRSFLGAHSGGLYADLARAQLNKLQEAQLVREKADAARRQAEAQVTQKAEDLRKQLEEQSARQTADAKQKISEQSKKDLEESRRQLAAQAKKELEDARKQVEMAQQQADDARRQLEDIRRQAAADAQTQVERARREAKEEAAKLASLAPAQPVPQPPSPPSPQIDASDIARLLQAHLKRVGCDPGSSEGNWDEKSGKALGLFNQYAKTTFDIKLVSLDALDAVRGRKDRVCPLICARGQRADGDRCVQISCGKDHFLNSSGECEKRSEPPSKPRELAHEQLPKVQSPRSSGGGKCFSFGGKTYCE
jgi:uncharacterized caspase-like protein